jgi:hypothetical protein
MEMLTKSKESIMFDIEQRSHLLDLAKQDLAASDIIMVLVKHGITVNSAKYVFEKAMKQIGRHTVQSLDSIEIDKLADEVRKNQMIMLELNASLHQNENINLS